MRLSYHVLATFHKEKRFGNTKMYFVAETSIYEVGFSINLQPSIGIFTKSVSKGLSDL